MLVFVFVFVFVDFVWGRVEVLRVVGSSHDASQGDLRPCIMLLHWHLCLEIHVISFPNSLMFKLNILVPELVFFPSRKGHA